MARGRSLLIAERELPSHPSSRRPCSTAWLSSLVQGEIPAALRSVTGERLDNAKQNKCHVTRTAPELARRRPCAHPLLPLTYPCRPLPESNGVMCFQGPFIGGYANSVTEVGQRWSCPSVPAPAAVAKRPGGLGAGEGGEGEWAVWGRAATGGQDLESAQAESSLSALSPSCQGAR